MVFISLRLFNMFLFARCFEKKSGKPLKYCLTIMVSAMTAMYDLVSQRDSSKSSQILYCSSQKARVCIDPHM